MKSETEQNANERSNTDEKEQTTETIVIIFELCIHRMCVYILQVNCIFILAF